MYQPDGEQRTEIMQRDVLLVATAGASLLNGMHFSPFFEPALILLRPFLAGTFLGTPLVVLYLTSLFVSALTLMLAGVTAALYERSKRLKESNATSLGIWFACTLILVLPAILGAGGLFATAPQ
jgi:hypothetical protein